MSALRKAIGVASFVDKRQTGTDSYTLTMRYRVLLDCGHTVIRDRAVGRAKCPRGCVASELLSDRSRR